MYMSQINVNNLTFGYEGSYDNIFENVSFQIDTDWKLGFIGRNGRGKTTFLQLMLGKQKYQGNITSSVRMDYFPYLIEPHDYLLNTMDVIEKMDTNYVLWMILREMNLLELNADVLYRPYVSLSNGEQTKVMLAVLFARENYFLMIDEPTNHLDIKTREVVCDYLNKKKGFILVSHDKWFLDSCVDHILVVNKSNIEVQKGNFSTWWENKNRQDAFEITENEKLRQEVKKLEDAAKRTAHWAEKSESTKIGFNPTAEPDRCISSRAYIGAKTKSMQKRRKAIEYRQAGAIEEKSKLLKNIETTEKLKILPQTHYKKVLVNAKNLTLFYGKKEIVKGINFTIEHGDRVLLQGENGCGKSSIIKAILKQSACKNENNEWNNEAMKIEIVGELEAVSGLEISYVSQDTSKLSGTLKEYARKKGIEERLFLALLRKLDFERVQFDKRIEYYSEGQKKKVLIAGSLCEQAHLYIWDEPLNFIDIFSRMQIEELIQQYQPTMLMVEHDRTFGEEIATKIIQL